MVQSARSELDPHTLFDDRLTDNEQKGQVIPMPNLATQPAHSARKGHE